MAAFRSVAFAVALVAVCVFSAPLPAKKGSRVVSDIPRKALAGPAEEFASHTIPDPTVAALTSDSAAYFLVLTNVNNKPTWSRSMPVDSTVGFSINIFSPIQSSLTVSLLDPQGVIVSLDQYATKTFWPLWDSDSQSVQGVSYNIPNLATGSYTLTITSDQSLSLLNSIMANISTHTADLKHGYVILYNANTDRIFSHLAAYTQQQGEQVGLVARMYSNQAYPTLLRGQVPAAKVDVVSDAVLEAVFPDGHRLRKPMHDDGLHNDGAANDGIFGGSFAATETGIYTVQSTLMGTDETGPFLRTAQHLVEVVPRMLQLTGQAFGDLSGDILNVYLEVASSSDDAATVRPYFQLWGNDATGKAIPVAWFSSLENIVQVQGKNVLALQVDATWITRANAVAPFTLHDVYVQDVQTWIPLDRSDSIALSLPADVTTALHATVSRIAATYDGSISLAMLQGPTPAARPSNATNGGKLILMHGYCADKNPFAVYPEDWSDNLFFLRPKVSMPHDEYAQRVVQFATDNGLSSYGLVGHSQGGIVTLHTLNYYHTGLDAAVGARKIQSLASPYRGNSAAGSTADLGSVFGLGCGSNNDMSVDGAVLWYAGISAASVAQTNYYTTQYDKGGLFGGGWCNMLTNALLNKPNDGTTEMVYATLDGGNNRGHTIGQCHIDGMNWPASYFDHTRNAEMNAAAAR